MPKIYAYIDKLGSAEDDLCFIAYEEKSEKKLGAIWIRKFSKDSPGYGFVDEKTCELSIALLKEARGKGIGSILINHMIENLPNRQTRLSLSVDIRNKAFKLYKRFGFKTVSEKNGTAIMLFDKSNS